MHKATDYFLQSNLSPSLVAMSPYNSSSTTSMSSFIKVLYTLLKLLYVYIYQHVLVHPLIVKEFMITKCINIGEFLSLVWMNTSNYYASFNKLNEQRQQEEGDVVVDLIKDNIRKKKNTPWLLHPDAPTSLFSLSEGRYYKLNLPKQINGRDRGYCCGSSKGYLAIITTPISDFYPQLFLWNPLSDPIKNPPLQLPSLTTIPCFIGVIHCLPKKYNATIFINKIDINMSTSTSNRIQVVAMLCNRKRTLAYCTPGDKSWSIYKDYDEDKDPLRIVCDDMLFSNNILYTLFTTRKDDQQEETTQGITTTALTCCTNTTKEFQVVIKSITYAHKFSGELYYEVNGGGFVIAKKYLSHFCLVESAQGELLMTKRNLDVFMKEEDVGMPEVDTIFSMQPPAFRYIRTASCKIYKFNSSNSNTRTVLFDKLKSLEEQVIFVSGHGSLTVPAQDFGQGNCMYFLDAPDMNVLDYSPKVSREAGVFYLEDGSIRRFLPSFKLPAKSHPCWFMPNLEDSS